MSSWSLWVLLNLNGALWVVIGPYASIWVPIGFYASLCVLMDLIDPCALIRTNKDA